MKVSKGLMILLSFSIVVQAKFHKITSDDSFDKLINRYPYAVVCFAESKAEDGADRDEKREKKNDFRDLSKRLSSSSTSGDFKKYLKKDVGFLLIDSSSKRVDDLDYQFNLKKLPTCFLFKDGRPVASSQIFEPISKHSILSLLDKYFSDDLDEIVDDKKEEEQLEREERIARYQAYANHNYPYYSNGYWPYSRSYWSNRRSCRLGGRCYNDVGFTFGFNV